MSIIGPRPALWNQFDLIEERDKYGASDLYPGLTGYAQIHGRDAITIEEKAKQDGYYVKHMGLWLDIKIFFGTIVKIFWLRIMVCLNHMKTLILAYYQKNLL